MLYKFLTHELTCQIWPIRAQKLDVERDQRVTIVRKVKSNFPVCKSWRVRGQFEIKSLILRLINTFSYFPCIKSTYLSADNFTKKLELSGPIPEPAILSGDDGLRML